MRPRTTWSCCPAARRRSARHDAHHDRSAQRVEGDLEVGLNVESGRVMRAEVTAPLYRGFEQILEGGVRPSRHWRWRRGSAASARSRSRSPPLPLFAMRWRPRSRRTGFSPPISRMRRRMPPIISRTSTSSSCLTSLARPVPRAPGMRRHGTVSQRSAALRHAMSYRRGRGCSNPWVSSPGSGRIVWPSSRPMSAARWSRRWHRYQRRRHTLGRHPARRALVRSLDGVHRALSGLSRGGGNFVVA